LRKVGFRSTGKVELRQSRGRGSAVPSLLFERDFEAEDADVEPAPAVMKKPMFQRCEMPMGLRAA
jgi:hypothetical protein